MDYWSRGSDWGLGTGIEVGISSWSLVEACIDLHLYCLSLCRLSFHNLGKLLPHLVHVCSTMVLQLIYNAYKVSFFNYSILCTI